MNRTVRTVPALLLVAVVLLVATATGASAAKLITGKQIKNESVTSVDVRNGTVTGADLKDGGVAGTDLADGTVTGADLAAGAVSSSDLAPDSVGSATVTDGTLTTSDLAEEARPTVRWNANSSEPVDTCAQVSPAGCEQIVVSGISEGRFLVSADATILNNAIQPSALNACAIVRNGAVLARTEYLLSAKPTGGYVEQISLQALVDSVDTNHPVSLRCNEPADGAILVENATLSVLRVAVPTS